MHPAFRRPTGAVCGVHGVGLSGALSRDDCLPRPTEPMLGVPFDWQLIGHSEMAAQGVRRPFATGPPLRTYRNIVGSGVAR
jgi:hypothetical protein